MGDQGRPDPEKAGTPSKKKKQEGRWETIEDDTGKQDLGKADTPSWGANGRQGGTRPREGGHTIQHRHTCGERQWQTMADKKRPEKADIPSQAHMWGDETMGLIEKGRQDLGKADAPSNTGTHAGRQWETLGDKGETRHREGKHIIQHRHTCGETTGDKWRQGPGRRTHQPTKRKQEGRLGDKGRQDETRPSWTP